MPSNPAQPAVTPSDLVQSFKALHTRESRKQALKAIFDELSPYEWRAAHDLAASRRFQFDIIGSLPLELAADIFSYLDVGTLVRLQLVSKRWQRVLRSPVLFNALMDPLVGKPTKCESYEDYLRKAENVHRFRNGKPRTTTTIDIFSKSMRGKFPLPAGTFLEFEKRPDPILLDDDLVSVDWEGRGVIIYNLRNLTSLHLYGAAKEKIHKFAASEDIVVFATHSGTVNVSDLDGSTRKEFKLYNGMCDLLACRGRTVVCGAVESDKIHIYIWDFDTAHGRSLSLARNQPPFQCWNPLCASPPVFLHLTADCEYMVFFTNKNCVSWTCTACCLPSEWDTAWNLHFGRFALDGRLEAHGSYLLSLNKCSPAAIQSVRRMDKYGQFLIKVRVVEKTHCIVFDERECCLKPGPGATYEIAPGVSEPPEWFAGEAYGKLKDGDPPLLVHSHTRKEKYEYKFARLKPPKFSGLVVNDQFVVAWASSSRNDAMGAWNRESATNNNNNNNNNFPQLHNNFMGAWIFAF